MLISCASAPKTANTTTTTENQPVTEYEQAKAHRRTVQTYELQQYAAETYATAEEAFKTGEAAYENKEFGKARTALNEADAQYLVIITNAFPQYFDAKEKEVAALRSSAEEIKAQVAARDEYQKAVTTWENALKEKQAGNYEQGAALLNDARTEFEAVYTKTKEKKARAEQSLEELRTNIEQVQAYQKQQGSAEQSE
jgi:hypothetical protein